MLGEAEDLLNTHKVPGFDPKYCKRKGRDRKERMKAGSGFTICLEGSYAEMCLGGTLEIAGTQYFR